MTHHRICSGRIGVLALNLRVQMTILSGICVVLRVSRGTLGGKPKRDMHRGPFRSVGGMRRFILRLRADWNLPATQRHGARLGKMLNDVRARRSGRVDALLVLLLCVLYTRPGNGHVFW